MNILPNPYCILQVHCSIYDVKLFHLIKDKRVQYKSNNSFPAIKQEGFSLSGAKATYHVPARDLFAFLITVSSEALTVVTQCSSWPPQGHPQPTPHSHAGTLWLKPGDSTDWETLSYFRVCPPRFQSTDKILSKEEILSWAVAKGPYCADWTGHLPAPVQWHHRVL